MIRIEHAYCFAMPVEAGFAFITDIANWPRYWPDFVRIESVRGGAAQATRPGSWFGFLDGTSSFE